jgi:hypothetical protein
VGWLVGPVHMYHQTHPKLALSEVCGRCEHFWGVCHFGPIVKEKVTIFILEISEPISIV